jgi:hypothetical protein
MYPRIAWELVTDPLGSAEHILGITRLQDTPWTAVVRLQLRRVHAAYSPPREVLWMLL